MNDINKDRTGFIGGSDAKRIMEGDWRKLYLEKMGLQPPDDLSMIFRVQLGLVTEGFHLAWQAAHSEFEITPSYKEQNIHKKYDWCRSQLDGWMPKEKTFLELKHTNARATPASMVATYMPQLAHYMNVVSVTHCYLSFIPGNGDPELFKVQLPQTYLDLVMETEKNFWWHVENKIDPGDENGSIETPSITTVLINDMRIVDMEGNNEWASAFEDWKISKAFVAVHKTEHEKLKSMIEPDVSEASGHGLTIKRDKRGALRFTVKDK